MTVRPGRPIPWTMLRCPPECIEDTYQDLALTSGELSELPSTIAGSFYMTPTGKVIKLVGEVAHPRFYQNGEGKNPEGALISFALNGVNYNAYTDKADEKFKGYKMGPGQIPLTFPATNVSPNQEVEVLAGLRYNIEELF